MGNVVGIRLEDFSDGTIEYNTIQNNQQGITVWNANINGKHNNLSNFSSIGFAYRWANSDNVAYFGDNTIHGKNSTGISIFNCSSSDIAIVHNEINNTLIPTLLNSSLFNNVGIKL